MTEPVPALRPASTLRLDVASARFLTWLPLPISAASPILDAIGLARGAPLPGQVLHAASAALPFSPGCDLTAIRFAGETYDIFALTRAGTLLDHGELDGTNEPIYHQNERQAPLLTPETAPLYARFFFHFVRGRLGHFVIVERVEDLPWAPDAPQAMRDEAADLLIPLTYLGIDAGGCIRLTSTVLFKNALFRTGIAIATRPLRREIDEEAVDMTIGQLALENETLLLEGLDVMQDQTADE
ncbi:hypothetical protein [Acidisoma sp. C75]